MKIKRCNIAAEQRKTRNHLIMAAPIFLLAFIYSFMVNEPHSHVAFDHVIEQQHYETFTHWRWLFCAAFIFSVAGAIRSFRRAEGK